MSNFVGISILICVMAIFVVAPWLFFKWLNLKAKECWNDLLNKYPPCKDVCVSIVENSIEQMVVDYSVYGKGYKSVGKWSLIVGAAGIHVSPHTTVICVPNSLLNEKFLYIPKSLLILESDWIHVKGSSDGIELVSGQMENICHLLK